MRLSARRLDRTRHAVCNESASRPATKCYPFFHYTVRRRQLAQRRRQIPISSLTPSWCSKRRRDSAVRCPAEDAAAGAIYLRLLLLLLLTPNCTLSSCISRATVAIGRPLLNSPSAAVDRDIISSLTIQSSRRHVVCRINRSPRLFPNPVDAL